MLAENIENWVQQERAEAIKQGKLQGRLEGKIEGKLEGHLEGELKAKHHVASNLIRKTVMDDQTICEIADLPVETIAELRAQMAK